MRSLLFLQRWYNLSLASNFVSRGGIPPVRLATAHRAVMTDDAVEKPEFWQAAFDDKQLMWGVEPCLSAHNAAEYFAEKFHNDGKSSNTKKVLIPGIGYGRNAKPFMERDMGVTGIEISPTAIDLARSTLGLTEDQVPIHCGSVEDMPYDTELYDGIFCYGLVYLLDEQGRQKLIQDCYNQLAPGGSMIFTVISKTAAFYGQGTKLGEDYFERMPGLKMYFYDSVSVEREFGPFGLVQQTELDEPNHGVNFPFINVDSHRSV